jgi:hypothetical protein
MPRGRAWLTCWFTHPASVPVTWVRVVTLFRVTRDPVARGDVRSYHCDITFPKQGNGPARLER